MESRGVNSKDSIKKEKLAFKSIWDNLCSYYMSIGVPYDEYWHGDYRKLKYYVEAHRLKLKENNMFSYLNGLYTFNAISIAMSNFHMDGKSHQVNNYLEEPLDLFSVPLTEEEKRQLEIEKAIRFFDAMKVK